MISEKLNKFIDRNCTYPDFPEKGVNFIDIFPLLGKASLKLDIKEDIVFVPESRGFLFAPVIGYDKVIPLRKHNLPGKLQKITAPKEYGVSELYFSENHLSPHLFNELFKDISINVAFFDDVCATGQTAEAFVEFINKYSLEGFRFNVSSIYFYLDLEFLKGVERLRETYPNINVKSSYTYVKTSGNN